MIMWLHKLFNPHCPHCREERDELRMFSKHECNTCEVLKLELERVYREKEILLQKLLIKDEPRPLGQESIPNTPIAVSGGRRFMPALVRQQMIDKEDQKSLQLLQNKKKEMSSTAKLEKEVLGKEVEIENAGEIS